MCRINTPIELRTNHETDRIALRGVRLTAFASGLSLKATLEQTFVNLESQPIEAIYTFPLPETAAVCGFEVRTGDRVLTGRVEENDVAVQQYDEAIGDGHGAFLLEQDRPDVFTARVGNLKPSQAATIAVNYVAPLEHVDRTLRLRFPTTIAPRYVSAAGTNDPLQTEMDADALNPPRAMHVPYGLTMSVQLQLGIEVRGVTSPTHDIRAVAPATKDEPWRIELQTGIALMDRDIVLEVTTAREPQPTVQRAAGPDDAQYLAISFVPEFDELPDAVPDQGETVFLLDCSGSMEGDSIHQATTALELCLRSLTPGTRFNVCRFGSSYELMAPTPAVYSSTMLENAIRFIRQGATLGGTEIFQPLEKILTASIGDGVRNVVVLTDGQVSNEPAVVALAQKHRDKNRLFTFGIGTAASGYLVRNLARVTGGAAEFISGRERIEDKVLRTFSRIGSPLVSDVVVDWGRGDLQTPGDTPPLFDGDVLRVLARAPGRVPESITLKCRTAAGPQTWTLPVPKTQTADDGAIATSWARAMLQKLEDETTELPTKRSRRESTTTRRAVTISKQFGLLCAETSFIAIEHRSLDERNAGMPELRRVPLQLAAGWGGGIMRFDQSMGPVAGGSAFGFARIAPAPIARMRKGGARTRGGSTMDAEPADRAFSLQAVERERGCEPPTGPDDVLFQLLALQSAEGWFAEGYDTWLKSVGHDLAPYRSAIDGGCANQSPGDAALKAKIVATVTVLVALRLWFRDRRDLWRRADLKARKWLKPTAIDEAAINTIVGTAGNG